MVRDAQQRIRRELATGQLTIATVMRHQPAELAERSLFEIVLMARNVGRRRLCGLNELAIGAGINLAMTLADSDDATREWVATHALRHSPPSVWQRLMET